MGGCGVASIAAALLLLACLPFCAALVELQAFRLLHVQEGDTAVGSQAAQVSFKAGARLQPALLTQDDLARLSVLVGIEECSREVLESLKSKNPGAVVVILPRDNHAKLRLNPAIRDLEQYLFTSVFPFPLYFTHWTEELSAFYTKRQAETSGFLQSLLADTVYLSTVNTTDPVPVQMPPIMTFQSWLQGAGNPLQLPTILICTHYTTQSVVPGLPSGSNSNGSGVVAFFELLRLFSILYSTDRTQPRMNMVFLLSGAGQHNFGGTKGWIAEEMADSRTFDNIEFALCLDTVGGADGLHFHASRMRSDPKVNAILQSFEDVAKEMNVPFKFVHKKVNLKNRLLSWEHEQFSVARVPAATLSTLSGPLLPSEKSSMFDSQTTLNITLVERNTQFIAEALARHMFAADNSNAREIFEGSFATNPQILSGLHEALSSHPREAAYLTPDSDIATYLLQTMKLFSSETRARQFPFDTAKLVGVQQTYFSQTTAVISAYKAKPMVFHMVVSAAVAVYLSALYFGVKVATSFF
mmetsp:Transcript_45785/g.115264  ORF Transcript_45785/g.115264 Transcript_45785/m.115264 type:complete len:526 (-) Transcript_45785:118-1695(-)